MSRCNNGFGRGDNESNCQEGNFTDAAARLSFDSQFSDANDVVTELSTLLTGGRLGAQNKQIVIEAYRSKLPDKEAGMRIAQQLIISSPEFQSSNTVLKNGQPRLPVADPQPKGVPYKAVVYIMLTGGADSFNMLVPMRCSTYYDYIRIRRGVEQRTNSLLKLDATESNQTCSFYGLHSKLKTAEQLYNNRVSSHHNFSTKIPVELLEKITNICSTLTRICYSLRMQVSICTACINLIFESNCTNLTSFLVECMVSVFDY